MQDIHAIGGGAGGGGRFFGGGDRRLRPHNQPNNQALKCPRCDSLNTKFCYYNNYNLSQPRHFCKSCRRYWTKGGVLRNVPVGGGCRKAKRLKPKSSVGAASSGTALREQSSNAQSSSSESSSLTAATPISATPAVAEEGSAQGNTTSTSAAVYPFPDARFFNGNHDFDHQPMANQSRSDVEAFTLEIGSFASLMGSSVDTMGFGMADIPTTSYGRVEQGNQAPLSDSSGKGVRGIGTSEEFKMLELTAGLSTDKMPATEALDWGSSGDGGEGEDDQGMFDLTAAVDPAYWSQPQWTDNDRSLNYLPQ